MVNSGKNIRLEEVDNYVKNTEKWSPILTELREILVASELTETWKWQQPCYTFENKNVILLGHFKDRCIVSFLKGSLMKDTKGILELPGKNTRTSRLINFTKLEEVADRKQDILDFLNQGIELEKSKAKIVSPKPELADFPTELLEKFKASPELKDAFLALTPGRQRGYLLYFSDAKQSQTRTNRIENYIPKILSGKGMHDYN